MPQLVNVYPNRETVTPAQVNLDKVKHFITKNDHPNPFIILSIIVLITLIFYIATINSKLEGDWSTGRDIVTISYYPITGTINGYYKSSSNVLFTGYTRGDAIVLENGAHIGAYHNNRIHWHNGTIWIKAT